MIDGLAQFSRRLVHSLKKLQHNVCVISLDWCADMGDILHIFGDMPDEVDLFFN